MNNQRSQEPLQGKNIIIGILIVAVVALGVFLFLNLENKSGDGTDKFIEEEEEMEEEMEDEILTFHVKTSPWKPYAYEENGEYTGIAYDVLDLVMTRLDVNYDFELLPWSRAMKMSEVGDVDALLSATYSRDREPFVTFTPEQLAYGLEEVIPSSYLHTVDGVFMVQTALRDEFVFKSIDQIALDGYRVGINQGYSYGNAIEAANWNKVSHVTEQESLKALMNGEIDMFLTFKAVGLAIRDEMGLHDEVSLAKGPFAYKSYQFLLFSKNSDYPNVEDLQRKVDEELLKIHASGEYDEIYNKYVQE